MHACHTNFTTSSATWTSLQRVQYTRTALPPHPYQDTITSLACRATFSSMHCEVDYAKKPSIGSVLRTIKKERHADRISHLRSIDHDVNFVARAREELGSPPLLANLRCGVWYSPPELSSGHCYFKSTDGHAGCWDFSLSRLNLQAALAAAASSAGSVMVVDSTRSGKRFPDALVKTVPIWCCVVNRAVAAYRNANAHGSSSWDTELHLPPWVTPSEASQIEAKLDGWVAALRRPALAPVLAKLVDALRLPLRPGWLCPTPKHAASSGAGGSSQSGSATSAYATQAAEVQRDAVSRGSAFIWVHCVCASEACTAAEARERASYTYIQGAGDDDENWSRGLTAERWWAWRSEVMDLARTDPEAAEALLIERLAARAATTKSANHLSASESVAEDVSVSNDATPGHGLTMAPCALWGMGLLLGPRSCAAPPHVWTHADAVLDVGSSYARPEFEEGTVDAAAGAAAGGSGSQRAPQTPSPESGLPLSTYLHVAVEDEGLGKSKRAQPSKDWWQRVVLPAALRYLHGHLSQGRRVLITCERGDDRSATVAAAALLALYDTDASTLRRELPPPGDTRPRFGKEDVRARLALLSGAYPAARVSRGLTKELNNFFVPEHGGWRSLLL